jgi:hypothetical protein
MSIRRDVWQSWLHRTALQARPTTFRSASEVQRYTGSYLLQVGQGALRDVHWLFVLHVDVLQHLLLVPQLHQVLLDQCVFPVQLTP